jgi:hypothetical protein
MKNAKFERFGQLQRQYHRSRRWHLSKGGLYIPHDYAEIQSDSLSWWDDVGFILRDRRVIVWWQHPRHVYAERINDQAWEEAGEPPKSDGLFSGNTANYRKIGKSRKKIISYTCRKPSEERREYYDKLRNIEKRLQATGIESEVALSWKRERLNWATGVSLVAPLEVRNEAVLAWVAALARRLVLGQTTLEAEFPAYRYGRSDWLHEQKTDMEGRLFSHRVAGV